MVTVRWPSKCGCLKPYVCLRVVAQERPQLGGKLRPRLGGQSPPGRAVTWIRLTSRRKVHPGHDHGCASRRSRLLRLQPHPAGPDQMPPSRRQPRVFVIAGGGQIGEVGDIGGFLLRSRCLLTFRPSGSVSGLFLYYFTFIPVFITFAKVNQEVGGGIWSVMENHRYHRYHRS